MKDMERSPSSPVHPRGAGMPSAGLVGVTAPLGKGHSEILPKEGLKLEQRERLWGLSLIVCTYIYTYQALQSITIESSNGLGGKGP